MGRASSYIAKAEEVGGSKGLFRFPTLTNLLTGGSNNNLAVHPATILELYDNELSIEPLYRQYAREFFGEIEDVPELPEEELTLQQKYTLQGLQLRARISRSAPELKDTVPANSILMDGLDYENWMQEPIYELKQATNPETYMSFRDIRKVIFRIAVPPSSR